MSAVRRIAGHTCRSFVRRAEVLRALALRQDPERGYVSIYDRTLTARLYHRLEKSSATHRCAECKRWIQVTPSHFRPDATHASLTRLTKDERRQLAARPIVFTVSTRMDTATPDGGKCLVLAKLPAYGFDVRHPQTQEVRGRGAVAWDAVAGRNSRARSTTTASKS